MNKLIGKKRNGQIEVVIGIQLCRRSHLLLDLLKDHLLAEGTDEQQIIKIAFDSFENKHFQNLSVTRGLNVIISSWLMQCRIRKNGAGTAFSDADQ